MSWGIQVATEHARRFGFAPHGIQPPLDELERNSMIFPADGESSASASYICNAGELPESLR